MPPIIAQAGPKASARVIDFFAGQIRNGNVRAAYIRAISEFLRSAQDRALALDRISPGFVGAYLDSLSFSVPTKKQHLAAVRVFFDWLVTGHVVDINPAASVRGSKLVEREGKTPVFQEAELRQLFDSLPTITLRDLRDRALLGVFVYTFARVSAVVTMKVGDYGMSGRRADLYLQEKGGVANRVPVHHKLREYLDEYIEAAKLAKAPEYWLWRSMPGRQDDLSEKPMSRHDALQVSNGDVPPRTSQWTSAATPSAAAALPCICSAKAPSIMRRKSSAFMPI